jgi:hypothetical protein
MIELNDKLADFLKNNYIEFSIYAKERENKVDKKI